MSELGKALELLHGAINRYRSVRATARWDDDTWTATFAPPHRIREERDDYLHVQVGANWWKRHGDGPAETGRGYGMSSLGVTPVSDLFNPAPVVSNARIVVLGQRRAAGRDAIAIEVTPREREQDPDEWVYEPEEILVEAQRGIVLRRTALSERAPWIELTDVAFDVDVEGVFEPPVGVEVRPWAPPPSRSRIFGSLVEAAATVRFPVYEPARLPAGSWLKGCSVTLGEGQELWAHWGCGVGHQVSLRQGPGIVPTEGWERLDEGLFIIRSYRIHVLAQRKGIGVIVDTDLGEDVCLAIARSLGPLRR